MEELAKKIKDKTASPEELDMFLDEVAVLLKEVIAVAE